MEKDVKLWVPQLPGIRKKLTNQILEICANAKNCKHFVKGNEFNCFLTTNKIGKVF